ncbi:site-specific integrase [Nguyenibacter vanlangensis]|uniref:Site-specific integrase n=1 Tax=Nguyenibacter vanlangensis TaxID=1216886 RepID=A0ABZ3D253_9PROT
MASIIRRGKSWRAMIVRKGRRVSATFDTKAQAISWATQAEAAILAGEAPAEPEKPAHVANLLVSDLLTRYATAISPSKRGSRWEIIRLHALARMDAFRVPARTFDPPALGAWRDSRLKTVSSETVNRELNVLSAVFNVAIKEWRAPMPGNPVGMIQRPPRSKPRKRRVSQAERELMAEWLGWDMKSPPDSVGQWTAFAFFLALATAMRKGEILSLTWGDVHLDDCYVHLEQTKNGYERDVPISSEAMSLLKILPPGPAAAPVVPIQSGTLDMTFRRARIDAGLPDLHFHDSRREATTELSKRLSNVLELSAVTGHRDLRVLKSYYRPKASDLAKKLG